MIRALILALLVSPAWAGPLDETRYCGVENIKRDTHGEIIRRAAGVPRPVSMPGDG